jgi:hypothetical protein
MVDCHEIIICKIHEKVLSGGPTQNPFCTFCIFFGYGDRGVRLEYCRIRVQGLCVIV